MMTPRPAQPTPGSGPPDSTQRMFLIADLHHVFEFEILDAAGIRGEAQDGVLRLGVQDEARRVRPSDRSRRSECADPFRPARPVCSGTSSTCRCPLCRKMRFAVVTTCLSPVEPLPFVAALPPRIAFAAEFREGLPVRGSLRRPSILSRRLLRNVHASTIAALSQRDNLVYSIICVAPATRRAMSKS